VAARTFLQGRSGRRQEVPVGRFASGNARCDRHDGTLAERSGNGLTIFSQYLIDTGRANRSDAFYLRVYHDTPESAFVEARIEAGERGIKGFGSTWRPDIGLSAVGAAPEHVGVSEFDDRILARVFDLEKIEASWACSQFVNVGNPHCVTFLKSPDLLPSMEQLGSEQWLPALSAIANSTGSDGMRARGVRAERNQSAVGLRHRSGSYRRARFRARRRADHVFRDERNGRRQRGTEAGACRCEDNKR
jgi:hypothetical protein